ncbi:histidyl-tRNA synthetase [Ruminococcus flavefaciens]|uniref:Histidine--tRNA ligase n=1 Tax=Ruminococcus flavefaciens TaxID=1265 RepID=A0A1H6HTM7_RUMFL|nr:histidine--tRNA ligase [Ruminococcus flavefaciens]SEH37578.1 histidyl-tRNA synthetase [Ruminococcus flavefaciens]
MAMNIKRPNGTEDVLPKDVHKWNTVEKIARETAESFGFSEIRIPTFENTDLFLRSVGETTDVVQKEMYTVKAKETEFTLRPEGTAGTIRAMLQNGLLNEALPQKVFYMLSCFRHERPQAGRLREFHQFGLEMAGSAAPTADAEVISLAKTLLTRLGLKNIELYINSIGCPTCRAKYHEALKAYFEPHKEELCDTCKERLVKNPMRLLDCKSPICQEIAKDAPLITDYLCEECDDHFKKLQTYLTNLGIEYKVNPKIVRGLDYYTKTVFEFVTTEIGAQGTVCGGGRYDGLIEQLGGQHIPALGFAMGIERLLLVMDKQGCDYLTPKKCDIYFATMGDAALEKAMELTKGLREFGYCAEYDLMGRGIKAQMKYANKIGAAYTVVLGDNELVEGKARLKEMESGNETEILLNDKFTANFENEYFNKVLDIMDDENGSMFAFTGEDK